MTRSTRYRLLVLSPAHLGCDEVYEPTSFYLDESTGTLGPFDPLRFIDSLDPAGRMELEEICGKGTIVSILELYRFIRKRGNKELALHGVAVCNGLVESYRQTMTLPINNPGKIQQELNNFTIHRTAFLPTSQRPYIPGSAVKGAFRTAYLNGRSRVKPRVQTTRDKGAARGLERALLDGGSLDTDPFRLLKVSDFQPIGEVRTRIVYAVNRKKQPSKLKGFEGRGPFQVLEVIEPGAVFEGTISLLDPPPGSRIAAPLSMEGLMTATEEFFLRESERENRQMQAIGTAPLAIHGGEQGAPFRIGRHSGSECVTIEGYRDIKIMLGGGKKRYDRAATTLWLAGESSKPKDNAGLRPFGWAALKDVGEDLWRELDAAEAEYRRQLDARATLRTLSPKDSAAPPLPSQTPSPAPSEPPPPPSRETWMGAVVSFRPQDGTVSAMHENRRATGKGKDLIPESLQSTKSFKKSKTTKASVEVEAVGNAFRIVKIEPMDS
jgi:CRISPR-associated protein Csm5